MFISLLDRYLFRQFLTNFALVLCALISIYFLVDFFERIDNFMETGKSMSTAGRYFLLKIPFMADMIYPVTILLASILTLGLLNHSREYLALKAGGLSTMRICLPILACALLFTLGSLAMAEWILPKTLAETNRIWYQEINHKIPRGVERRGYTFHKGEKGIYSFRRTTPSSSVFLKFSYAEWGENYTLVRYITAEKAQWQNGRWTLLNGQITTSAAKDENNDQVHHFTQKVITLPEGPEEFFVLQYKANELALSDLWQRAVNHTSSATTPWLNLHSRLSFLFIGLPLVLLGLPILLLLYQRWGRDLTLALPVSCGMAFAAWGWWSTTQSMARAYNLNPILSSWSIHLLIGTFGFWLLRKQDC